MKNKRITALLAALLIGSPLAQLPVASSAYAATKMTPPTSVLLHPDRTVTWNNVDKNSGYTVNVYNQKDDKLIGYRSATINATTLKLDDLMAGTGTYYVRIITRGNGMGLGTSDSDESAKSNILTISYSVDLSAPDAPVLGTDGKLTWTNATNNGYTLNVYHSPSNTLVTTKTVAKDTTSFDVTEVIPATGQYYVKLIANGDGESMTDSAESKASNTVALTKTVADLQAPTPVLNFDRTATWNGIENNNGYRIGIYRDATNEVVGFATAPKNATSYDLSSLIKDSGTYYIKIMTLGAKSNSEDSAKSNSEEFFLEPHLFAVPQTMVKAEAGNDQTGTILTVNAEEVGNALDKQTDAYNLLVRAPETLSSHLRIDGNLLLEAANRSANAELRVQTALGSLTLPIAQLDELARSNSATLSHHTLDIELTNVARTAPVPATPPTNGSGNSGSTATDGSMTNGNNGSTDGMTATGGSAETDGSYTTDGSSVDGSSVDGSSTDGSSTDGSSTDGSSTGGSSTDGSSTDGISTGGTSTDGSSTGGTSTDGSSTGGSSTGGTNVPVVTAPVVTAPVIPDSLVTLPVRFGLHLLDSSLAVVADFTEANAYLPVQANFTLPIGTSADSLSGVRVDSAGKLQPLPTTLKQNTDGTVTATFNYRGTGIYGLTKKALSFGDLPASYYASEAIGKLASRSIINGFEDGTFRADSTVTRSEFATMLVNALGLSYAGINGNAFSDVTAGDWYNSYVYTAYNAGLISGVGESRFAPEGLITQEQMSAMVARALKFAGYTGTMTAQEQAELLGQMANSGDIEDYAQQPVALCFKTGILTGHTLQNFKPGANADRGMAADMLYRMMKALSFIN